MSEDIAAAHTPVAASSALARLRARAAEIAEEVAEFHIPVPRYTDPQVWVRYRPLDPDRAAVVVEKRAKAKAADGKAHRLLYANIDLLVEGCAGIYLLDGQTEVSIDEHNPDNFDPTFRSDAAAALVRTLPRGVNLIEGAPADHVCRWLFATDADLMAHAAKYVADAGMDVAALEERVRGE